MKNSVKFIEDPRITYLALRKTVGGLGILFPIILILGSFTFNGIEDIPNCKEFQPSISAYYHTGMRDFFVGILSIIAIVFFAYRSKDNKYDNIAGTIAGFFTLGVAFLPTSIEKSSTCMSKIIGNSCIGKLHLISATLLFVTLAFFSLVLFTKDAKRKKSILIYKICGGVMLLCIFLIGLYFLFLKKEFPELEYYKPVLWLESIALFSFGISWLRKGELL